MFTGIIEEIGVIRDIKRSGGSMSLEIKACSVLDGTKSGDSIAVNGICLTVKKINESSFTADVMPETVRRSSLCKSFPGAYVNLERAMMLGGRLNGHLVTGHIDGTGIIVNRFTEDNAVVLKLKAGDNMTRYIVEKGSVTLDGVSLTVTGSDKDCFTVSLIPETCRRTILADKNIGDSVNIENDIIGKYLEKFSSSQNDPGRMSLDFLAKNGF